MRVPWEFPPALSVGVAFRFQETEQATEVLLRGEWARRPKCVPHISCLVRDQDFTQERVPMVPGGLSCLHQVLDRRQRQNFAARRRSLPYKEVRICFCDWDLSGCDDDVNANSFLARKIAASMCLRSLPSEASSAKERDNGARRT